MNYLDNKLAHHNLSLRLLNSEESNESNEEDTVKK